MMYRLHNQLGTAAAGESDLASGHRVSITRSWALQRARRCGYRVSDVGTIAELDVDSLQVTQEPRPQGWLAARLQGPVKFLLRAWAGTRRHVPTLVGTVLRIRSPRDLWRFIAMVVRAVAWRLKNVGWTLRRVWLRTRTLVRTRTRTLVRTLVRAQRTQRRQARKRLKIWLGLQAKSKRYVQRLARYPLGAEIAAAGRGSSAVFAASTRVASRVGDHHVDLLVVDSPRTGGAAIDASRDAPRSAVAVLSELHPRLSVQAFNPEAVNPVGWSASCQPQSAPLKSLMSLPAGGVLSLQLGGELLDELRSLHHLEDKAAYHRSPTPQGRRVSSSGRRRRAGPHRGSRSRARRAPRIRPARPDGERSCRKGRRPRTRADQHRRAPVRLARPLATRPRSPDPGHLRHRGGRFPRCRCWPRHADPRSSSPCWTP